MAESESVRALAASVGASLLLQLADSWSEAVVAAFEGSLAAGPSLQTVPAMRTNLVHSFVPRECGRHTNCPARCNSWSWS